MAPLGGIEQPPWSGWIETTGDALLILEAARRGLIPRVTRRLAESERTMISSGSVFVFDEDESGIKRWTDGFFWSPSRILGNFLLYRETDKKGAGHGRRRSRGAGAGTELEDEGEDTGGGTGGGKGESLSRPRAETKHNVDRHRERTLMGSLTNNYKFKADGLMKKLFPDVLAGHRRCRAASHLLLQGLRHRIRPAPFPVVLPELAS
ncbi:Gti1/Pac2 family-domain-containing protein [Mycena leptocephala]|nr:Gti1/Pac2 family-domain-containing protein [Mycena leptocephala]